MVKTILVAAVVALLVAIGAHFGLTSTADTAALGAGGPNWAQVFNNIDNYANGVGQGSEVMFNKDLVIGPGQNQVAWKNTTGRTVYIPRAELGFVTGTASSSWLFYVATSSAATLTNDYARPTGTYLLIDGAVAATSTSGGTFFNSTSTSAGVGMVSVQPNAYLNFQVQERFACKTVGACETATSTNRGVSNFNAYFQIHYAP